MNVEYQQPLLSKGLNQTPAVIHIEQLGRPERLKECCVCIPDTGNDKNSDCHLSCIESMVGLKLGKKTIEYLNEKSQQIEKDMTGSTCQLMGRQVIHILKLPVTAISLSLQTIADSVLCTGHVCNEIGSCGAHIENTRNLEGRIYNCFVADPIIWLSLIPSLLCFPIYAKSNSLHLGTRRELDFKDDPKQSAEESIITVQTPLIRQGI